MRRLQDRAWLLFLGWMTVFAAAYSVAHVTGPHWLNSGSVFNAIGLSAVAAILVGARRNAPGRRLTWYLFALAQAIFVTGDVLGYNYERFFGTPPPYPSVADAFYLAFYLPLIAGVLLLIREQRRGRDRESLVDAVIVTVAAAALSWTYLMSPYVHASLGLPTKLVSVGYPLMDVLVLGVLVRLTVTGGRPAIGFVLLVLGFAALLVTDAIFGWLLLNGGYQTGRLLDVGWAGFYALLGRRRAAPVHPTTVRAAPRGGRTAHGQTRRAARWCNPDGSGAHVHPSHPRRASRHRGSGRGVGRTVCAGPPAHDRSRAPP